MGSILWDFLWWNMRRRIGNLWKLCKTMRLSLLPEACCNAMHAMHLSSSGSWYIGEKGHSFSLIAGCACLLWRCEDMGNKNVFSHSHHFFTLQHLDRICTLPLQSSMSSFTDFNYFFFHLQHENSHHWSLRAHKQMEFVYVWYGDCWCKLQGNSMKVSLLWCRS